MHRDAQRDQNRVDSNNMANMNLEENSQPSSEGNERIELSQHEQDKLLKILEDVDSSVGTIEVDD